MCAVAAASLPTRVARHRAADPIHLSCPRKAAISPIWSGVSSTVLNAVQRFALSSDAATLRRVSKYIDQKNASS